jgi:hypothetical protein
MPFIDALERSMLGSRAAKPPSIAKSFQFFPISSRGEAYAASPVFQNLNPLALRRGDFRLNLAPDCGVRGVTEVKCWMRGTLTSAWPAERL